MPSEPSNRLDDTQAFVPNVNTLWARVLVDELVRCGLREVCISPGSRSAPLVFQFAAHPRIVDHSIVDERSAGFFALGLARASARPVALLCTSGTAAANYFPAICEAEGDDVPLLVLTGDRPPEDHDCGAQQVMEQARLYGEHVRWFHRVAQPEATAHKLAYLRSLACRAIHRTQFPQPGPVHLDLPFSKPLEPVAVGPDSPAHVPRSALDEAGSAIDGRADSMPWIRIHAALSPPDEPALEQLVGALDRAKRPLIFAGTDPDGPDYRQALRALAEHAGIPILAEPGSGLRHWNARGANVIGAGDLVAGSRFHDLCGRPDLIVRTGSAPLSWATQALLKNAEQAFQIAVGPHSKLVDPDHNLSLQLAVEPGALFDETARRIATPNTERRAWLHAHQRADALARCELDRCLDGSQTFSAPGMWHALGALLPDGCGLYYSSSMLVRHLDAFMCAHDRDLDVYFNRGLNGIDGVVSTGAGIAAGRRKRNGRAPQPTLLVIGDVALRHDATALLLARELNLDLTVLVVDNHGGEIFEYLPSAGYGEVHERHFATSESTPIREIIPRGIELLEPADWRQFSEQISASLANRGLHVIRFPTDRRIDHRLRGQLFDRIAQRVEQALQGSDSPYFPQA
ncbi:MAG: 2-succinyl-5-enolpyruvyl-6-hydroxy-3-cyclohexene-1-carboxylic-acid synthase [Wenzhouxiangellaceae bacterium]|nr:2-succinyl-5-enolpyruvyl-6-hydroxy-3-cyclohexene-1-carboxylic-acid synthase [Wenzhouxiangellaceae bacterium]MBS3747023.1 2-succinyl-5-enolpyruvyl-6-hydroxy-3-cyclohexene-1-carboxylic-acid synthase [Wenzhouxiangellaceae bacterium]